MPTTGRRPRPIGKPLGFFDMPREIRDEIYHLCGVPRNQVISYDHHLPIFDRPFGPVSCILGPNGVVYPNEQRDGAADDAADDAANVPTDVAADVAADGAPDDNLDGDGRSQNNTEHVGTAHDDVSANGGDTPLDVHPAAEDSSDNTHTANTSQDSDAALLQHPLVDDSRQEWDDEESLGLPCPYEYAFEIWDYGVKTYPDSLYSTSEAGDNDGHVETADENNPKHCPNSVSAGSEAGKDDNDGQVEKVGNTAPNGDRYHYPLDEYTFFEPNKVTLVATRDGRELDKDRLMTIQSLLLVSKPFKEEVLDMFLGRNAFLVHVGYMEDRHRTMPWADDNTLHKIRHVMLIYHQKVTYEFGRPECMLDWPTWKKILPNLSSLRLVLKQPWMAEGGHRNSCKISVAEQLEKWFAELPPVLDYIRKKLSPSATLLLDTNGADTVQLVKKHIRRDFQRIRTVWGDRGFYNYEREAFYPIDEHCNVLAYPPTDPARCRCT